MRRPRIRRGSRRGNHFLAIVLVLAVAGAVAAAGSGLEDTPEPTRGEGGSRVQREAARSGAALTIAWAERPGSLDPALASDHTAETLVWNLFDPLVRVDADGEPTPSLATAWRWDANGRRITFTLRPDARWSNGDAVTAHDFEYAWKRVLSPEVDSPHAPRLFGIEGASAYHGCSGRDCASLADAVGVRATSGRELAVSLTARRPWFPRDVAHPAFAPVHRSTVEGFGDAWADRANIVTNGPFTLAELSDDAVTLVKNREWHGAGRVDVGRVGGRFVPAATARLQAFDAAVVMALDGAGLPEPELPALRERREYESYPAVGAYLYAFNLRTVADVHQRRAMALAVDRRRIVDDVLGSDATPASRFVPGGMTRGDAEAGSSRWLPPDGDLAAAREELERATSVERRLTLVHVDSPDARDVATAVRDAWRELGIDTALVARPADAYPNLAGPLPTTSVDLYQVEVQYRSPEPVAALSDWRCRAARNQSGFCHPEYDAVLARARREPDPGRRSTSYVRAEEILSGPAGLLPGVPIYWPAYSNLEALSIRDSFTIDPLGHIDLAAVDLD